MFYKLILFVTIFTISSLSASNLKDIESFKGEFEQIIVNPSNKEISYEGKLFIKEPFYVLWQYEKPIPKNVYIVNNYATIDEPELEQAIITRLVNEINIIELIKKAKKVSKNKYKANIFDTDYYLIVENENIKTIEYEDNLENKVTINFFNTEKNSNIDTNIFKFLAPDYYDIIEK